MKTVYTPQLNDADLVHQLYLKAKVQQVPMTVLTRYLLREALDLPQPPGPPRKRARRRKSRKMSLSRKQVAELTEELLKSLRELDQLMNTFGSLAHHWCRLAAGKGKAKRASAPNKLTGDRSPRLL